MSRKNKRTDEQIINAVKNNVTIAGVLRELDLSTHGGGYYVIRNHIKRLNLDTSHWLGRGHLKGKTHGFTPCKPLSEILVKNSQHYYTATHNLKKRLIKENVLNNKCYICGISEWIGKTLSLHLDHINGIRSDNRLENLRLLCPNCHSLTPTYAGKNKKFKNNCIDCKKPIPNRTLRCFSCYKIYNSSDPTRTDTHISGGAFKTPAPTDYATEPKCLNCGADIQRKSKKCKNCHLYTLSKLPRKTKIEWPSNDILKNMVEQTSYLAVARQLGVSDNAIRKRLKNH